MQMSKRVARRKLWQKMKKEAEGYVLPPPKQLLDTELDGTAPSDTLADGEQEGK
jgi:hypothetical protein